MLAFEFIFLFTAIIYKLYEIQLQNSANYFLVSADIGGKDYYLEPTTLTFSAWSTPGKAIMCSTVLIIDDNIVGNTEEFHIYLTSNDSRVIINEKERETIVYIMEDIHDSK